MSENLELVERAPPPSAMSKRGPRLKPLMKTVSWSEKEDNKRSGKGKKTKKKLSGEVNKAYQDEEDTSNVDAIQAFPESDEDRDDYDDDQGESEEGLSSEAQDILSSPVQPRAYKLSKSGSSGKKPKPHQLQRRESRSTTRLKTDDENTQLTYEKYEANRKIPDSGQPTSQDAYDFFCTELALPEEPKSPIKALVDEVTRILQEDPDVKVTTDGLFKQFGYEWSKTEPAQVSFFDWNELEKLLFKPSSEELSLEEKLGPNARPRFPQSEGLYVGVPPTVRSPLRRQMAQRIVRQEGRGSHWFSSDGSLVALPNPLQRHAVHPEGLDESGTQLELATETVYCSPNPPSKPGMAPVTDQPGVADFNDSLEQGNQRSRRQTRGLTHCQLEVDVATVVFEHHHLFSLEHHVSQRLLEAFTKYQKTVAKKEELGLDKRLSVLYTAVDELRDRLEACVQRQEREFQTRRLDSYKREIKILREQRDQLSGNERSSVKEVLHLWKSLREVRSQQDGYQNTTVKVLIRKEAVSLREDRAEWDAELDRELAEAQESFDAGAEDRQKEYQAQLEEWKEMHSMGARGSCECGTTPADRRKEARLRVKQRQRDAERGSGTADMAEMARDEQLLNEEEMKKPEPPADFNAKDVRNQLEKSARNVRRCPGETKISLELSHTGARNTDNLAEESRDNREKSRKAAVTKTKIYVKILFNGKEVCQSASKGLTDDFTVPFGQIFPIQIVQWPEELKLQIHEISGLRSTVLSEVCLTLPNTDTTLDQAEVEDIDFTSGIRIKHDHKGLGSCVDFSSNADGSEVRSERLRGKLFARAGWARTTDGVILAPPKDQWSPPMAKGRENADPLSELLDPASGSLDPGLVDDWMTKHDIDPHDPANVALVNRIQELAKSSSVVTDKRDEHESSGDMDRALSEVTSGYFRLDSYHDQLVFGTQADLDSNLRFKMLQLRARKVAEFKNYKMVPILEKEIPRGLLEASAKRSRTLSSGLSATADPLRAKQKAFLEKLRAEVQHRFSLARTRKRHADVVNEDPLPTMATLGTLCGEMVPEQRPLKPARMKQKRVHLMDAGQKVAVLVSVVRAYDVPVRAEHDPLQSQASLQVATAASGAMGSQAGGINLDRDGPREARVHSYVEAKFQGRSARTTVAPGPNPTWNQELSLPFRSPNNDLSPESLSQVRDHLHLQLFDEIAVDLLEDESERGCQVHQRFERRFLGSMAIPFASLYYNTRIEGTFRLQTPSVLLGYERSTNASATGAGGPDGPESLSSMTSHGHGHSSTLLSVYVSVSPPLSAQRPALSDLAEAHGGYERMMMESKENEDMVKHCQKWSSDLKSKFPDREVSALVSDIGGRATLITRYFRALRPPDNLFIESGENGSFAAEDRVSWFVSLIPYVPKNALFPGLPDIWPTCDHFLSMLVGSECEHAVLLANFLSALGKRSYLVLGAGVPEGDTAYVMTLREDSGDNVLWNAVTGERFSTSETFCPLQAVYAVANENNVWANMQASSAPARLRWDLTATQDWNPLFTSSSMQAPSSSLQPTQLQMAAPDVRAAKPLKDRIERTCRDSIMNLRRKMNLRTNINFSGNAVLRKLMPGLEASRGGNGRSLTSEHVAELSRISASHKVCGFPLHMAYTDLDSILEALHATGAHLSREPGVEFALAVHVEPFPATVMSVWVYVATMVRRR